MAKKQKYDWKKTVKKGLRIAAEVILAGLLVYVTEEPAFLAVAPLLEMLYNYVKHQD